MGRRPDGYHLIDSVFLPLDLADELTVTSAPGGPAVALALRAPPGIPDGPGNLAFRAAEAFLAAAALERRVTIRLVKQVPAGAGLGGGSSDAGAVLRALCRLHPEALDPDALPGIALGLGADVPFFLDPRPARVRGIGERIEPLGGFPTLPLLLVHPGIPLATAEVYAAWDDLSGDLTPPEAGSTIAPPFAPRDGGRAGLGAIADLVEGMRNDLEPAALRLRPEIRRLREAMGEAGALGVSLSGSGPTVFGVFESLEAARRAADRDWGSPQARAWVAVTTASP